MDIIKMINETVDDLAESGVYSVCADQLRRASQQGVEVDAPASCECRHYPECVYITELCDNCGRIV